MNPKFGNSAGTCPREVLCDDEAQCSKILNKNYSVTKKRSLGPNKITRRISRTKQKIHNVQWRPLLQSCSKKIRVETPEFTSTNKRSSIGERGAQPARNLQQQGPMRSMALRRRRRRLQAKRGQVLSPRVNRRSEVLRTAGPKHLVALVRLIEVGNIFRIPFISHMQY